MGIFNLFKKKKELKKGDQFKKPKKKEIKEAIKKPSEKVESIKEVSKKAVEVKPKTIKKKAKFLDTYRILKSPNITEKATSSLEKNQYVFKVWPGVNKIEVKKAIESLYGVDVLNVRIIRIPPKRRRLGRIEGWRKGYKKAIVKIKEGQKIEVLPR